MDGDGVWHSGGQLSFRKEGRGTKLLVEVNTEFKGENWS